MAKIGRGSYRYENHWGEYDIMYSSKDSHFFVYVDKLFSGAVEFYDAISDDKTHEIKMVNYTYGRIKGRMIFAATEKQLTDSVNTFHRLYVTTSTSEEKVILYYFTYSTETQQKDNTRFSRYDSYKKFGMEFKYYIASKKILGANKLYTDIDTHQNIDRYVTSSYNEIAWSQELEDFIKLFSQSFDALVNRMKPFFEVEGKIIELIGRNILTQ